MWGWVKIYRKQILLFSVMSDHKLFYLTKMVLTFICHLHVFTLFTLLQYSYLFVLATFMCYWKSWSLDLFIYPRSTPDGCCLHSCPGVFFHFLISGFSWLLNLKFERTGKKWHCCLYLCFSFILKDLGCQTTLVNKQVVEFSDVVFLAVKPHLIVPVIKEVMSSIDPSKHLIVSVAAAITTVVIEAVSNSYVIVLPCRDKSFDKLVNK